LFQAPRGTQDWLPEDQKYITFLESRIKELAYLFGYGRIDTPVFENSALFIRTVGVGTDIVEKEMYTFSDFGGSQLTLRPEGTASVCRAYIEHGMASRIQPVKVYYHAPIFRYERPQAGRFRQHHQFGFEAIGEMDALLDAEVIELAWKLLCSLGLSNLTLQINSIGCSKCRPAFLSRLREYYAGDLNKLCQDCKVRIDKNTLRLLDCKKPECQLMTEGAPHCAGYLCPECHEHFERLQSYLSVLNLPFEINHRLVRGLDYYSKTVFEIQPEDERGQSTIAGGGRYDGLVGELSGKHTPAVGFATGVERIIINLKKQNVFVPEIPKPDVYIAWLGDSARQFALELACWLRQKGIATLMAYSAKSLKAQMRQADGGGCRYVAILGEDEVAKKCITLRDLSTATQDTITIDAMIEKLSART